MPGRTAAVRRLTGPSSSNRDIQEEKKKNHIQSKLQILLFRHKELLKKDIMKKRALLEKELLIEIQVMELIEKKTYLHGIVI